MNIHRLFLLLLAVACSPLAERVPSNKLGGAKPLSEVKLNEKQNEVKEPSDWLAYQDSLRVELLKSKPNKQLKGGLLEELYIRNLVKVMDNQFWIELPFDLHGFDCGTPDCYTTNMKFNFPIEKELKFPMKFTFSLHEFGCVDSEFQAKGSMRLVELDSNFVNYYSEDQRSNLLIFGPNRRKEYVYYFENVSSDSIKGNLVNQLLNDFSDEDINTEAPYRISQMLNIEYEKFMEN